MMWGCVGEGRSLLTGGDMERELGVRDLADLLDEVGAERVRVAADGSIEELETVLSQEVGRLGAKPFERELQQRADAIDEEQGPQAPCPNCGRDRVDRHRRKQRSLLTCLGEVRFQRAEYHCSCGTLFAPADQRLGIRREARLSPALERLAADMGAACSSFEEAQELLRRFHGRGEGPTARTIGKAVDRVAGDVEALTTLANPAARPSLAANAASRDSTLILEVDGGIVRTRSSDDGGATAGREAKVGVVYRTEDRVEKPPTASGLPGRARIRGASNVARIEHWESFARRFYREAQRRGVEQAGRVVLLGDGAEWIDQLHREFVPEAIRILDFWHALQHLCEPARIAFDGDDAKMARYRRKQAKRLLNAEYAGMIAAMNALPNQAPKARRAAVRNEVAGRRAYFAKRRDQINYPRFRAWNLPIGSGLIEGRIRNLVKGRLDVTGAIWHVPRANNVLTLRAHNANQRAAA